MDNTIEQNNLFIEVKNAVPRSLLMRQTESEIQRVKVIFNLLKSNPKTADYTDDSLIKESVFLILRNRNLDDNYISAHMIHPILLIGLRNVVSADLDLSQSELIQKVLEENNEVDVNNKMNVALSNVISNLPSDLESRIPPEVKSVVMEKFASGIPNYNDIRDAMNKEVGRYVSNDNNSNNKNNDYLTMNIGNDYKVLANDYEKKHKSFVDDEVILASYVDTEPEIHVDKNSNIYIHDAYSKSLYQMPNQLKNVSLNEVENILTKHEVDANQVDDIIDDLRSNKDTKLDNHNDKVNEKVNNNDIEEEEDDEENEKLLKVIIDYQKDFTAIDYIVRILITLILFTVIVYIAKKRIN